MLGGLIFVILVVMSVISIVGRKLFNSPIEGDVELIQMSTAVGMAAFFPYCEVHDHNIKVDVVTNWMPQRMRAALDALAHGLLAVMAALLAWRTGLQSLDIGAAGEVSTLLLVPMWIPQSLMVPSFVLLCLTALFRLGLSLSASNGCE
jgi:TRAP-type C4-dicarboxylate transport system permease small subunit